MEIEENVSSRGFAQFVFKDRYGKECSLQESSLATEAAIWLGCDEARMHLTQEQVADLIPLLQRFVETGGLRHVER